MLNRKTKSKAFTIVELLTVISVITLIIGLLVPALNKVNRIAKDMKQRAQFHAMTTALEMFKAENDTYPESFAGASSAKVTCGAQILAEALLGRDLQGFDSKSCFDAYYDYTRSNFASNLDRPYFGSFTGESDTDPAYKASIDRRKGPYLNLENSAAYNLASIYSQTRANSVDAYPGMADGQLPSPVISDIYFAKTIQIGPATGSVSVKTGTPVLYFKANISMSNIDYNTLFGTPEKMIYNFEDNEEIVKLGKVKAPDVAVGSLQVTDQHSVITQTDGWKKYFYEKIRNKQVINQIIPNNKDKYILWSAGFDGDYGTGDDIFNFGD